jgi:DNA-binding MarR family transcriptional regulator
MPGDAAGADGARVPGAGGADGAPVADGAPSPDEQREPSLGLLCFVAARSMETRVLEALVAAGFADLTMAQGRVFARLAPGGSRVSDLARQSGVTKQTAGFLVDQLERGGYVRRVPDPSDGRARLVRMAARGEEALAVARGVEARVEAEWAAHLGGPSTARLREALTRLREITDPYR